MILVAFDTSTPRGVVALRGEDGAVLEERLPEGAPSSETLLPAVERLLAAAGLEREEVEALAVGVGPGSFTGLRVSMATAMGWASAAGLPIAAVPSLDAVAWPALASGRPVLVATDARKGEVFAAAYAGISGEGLAVRLGEVRLAPPEDAAAFLVGARLSSPVLVGSGAGLVVATGRLPSGLAPSTDFDPLPCGEVVLTLGERLHCLGRTVTPRALAPFYVRPPDARPPRPPQAGGGPPSTG